MATNAELASKLKELEEAIKKMNLAFESYERDTYYDCHVCGKIMRFIPIRNNYWCSDCHEELDLYAGKKTGGVKK